ncbi:MAG: VWA domain-containing protein [Paludibacteraceae bacterium]|nr:VWA domain-containing protein [Paludibacteraceae bacterium]
MKKFLLTLLLISFYASWSLAQEPAKLTRRIYLWDVTLSMKGYQNKTPDIYDDVVAYLVRCINDVKDESTEIYILPFQTSVLESWSAKATVEGKKKLIDKVKNYKNDQVTNTDIVSSIQYVKQNIINPMPNRNTFFALLTDGEQSKSLGGIEALMKELGEWDRYAVEQSSYMLYVMLTPEAVDDRIIELAKGTSTIETVKPEDSQLDVIDILPQSLVTANLKDSVITIALKSNGRALIPEGLRFEFQSLDEEGFVNLKGETVEKNADIVIPARYGKSYDTLKIDLPEEYEFPVQLKLINKDEIKNRDKKIVVLSQSTISVKLINRPEKVLRISLKK